MRDRELPQAYARAVYDAALAAWVRDLGALRDNLRQESDLRATLDDESLSFEARRSLVDRLLPAGATPEVRNFAYTLVTNSHFALLDDVIVELRRLQRYGAAVVVAEVTTAVPPSPEERARVEQRLVRDYGQGIDITWRLDPAIIGGVVIRVGDEVVDDSIAARLQALQNSLKGRM